MAQVRNITARAIVAFGWHKDHGPAEEVIIPSGKTWCVKGPCIGQKNGKPIYVDIPQEVVIVDKPSNNWRRHFLEEENVDCILDQKNPDVGITVHYCEE